MSRKLTKKDLKAVSPNAADKAPSDEEMAEMIKKAMNDRIAQALDDLYDQIEELLCLGDE